MHDDPFNVVTAVQFSQEDQQVVAYGARHTAVRELQSFLGGGEFAASQSSGSPPHHVAVELMFYDQRSGPAQ
jgi:hypothetical protein